MRRFQTPLGDARQLGATLLVFGTYFVGAKLGLRLAFFHPSATPVWPATGIAFAALLIAGYRVWPGIFLGAFLANLTTEGTVWTSLGIAAGNTLEGLAGAYLVSAYANGRYAFDRAPDIFKFALLGGVASPPVSATIGVTTLALGGFAPWADYGTIWFTWWLGDAAGALIVTPLLLLWAQGPQLRWQGRAILERTVFVATLLPVSWIVFGGVFAFPYLTAPFLIWAAFRFDQRETATVIATLAVIAIWGTVERVGPFVGATPNESLLALQTFMSLMVLMALPLAAVVKDNARRIEAEQRARQEAERAAERAARLQAVTAALSGAVTQAQVVDVILRQGTLALGARAGWVSVLTDDGDSLQLLGQTGAYSEEFVNRLRRVPLSESRPMTQALQTGSPLFFDSAASTRSHFPEVHLFYEDVARAVLPLSSAGRPIGVLVLNFATRRVFDEGEQGLMVTLAQQCALALERAQFYDREHYVAKTLQRAFLPGTLPEVPGIRIDAVCVPGAAGSDIGGDWYDVFRLADGRIAVSVGDVVGSGVEAAVMMGQIRQSIRAAALEGYDPSAVLDRASRVLQATYEREGMATTVFGVLDPVSRTFMYAIAGHPPPALATPDGEIQALGSGAGPLGVSDERPSAVRTVSLPAGALLVLYTDGLIESTRNMAEGEALLLEAMRAEVAGGSERPARALLERVVHGHAPSDDVAIVCVSIDRHLPKELALTLPAEPASLREVRRAVRQLVLALGLDQDQAFRTQVALGEAINNAVEHAYGAGHGTFSVRIWRDANDLNAEVTDNGRWRPERAESHGHGLTMMRELSDRLNVAQSPSGTRVSLTWSLAPTDGHRAASAAPPSRGERPSRSGAEAGGPADTADAAGTGDYPRFRQGSFAVGQMDGIPVVSVVGDVDLSNAEALAGQLEAAARLDKRAVIVSLSGASFFDSAAIHVLFRFQRRLATNRQRLLLAVARDRPARRIVDVTGLAAKIPVYETPEEAIAGLRGGH